ncbi:MAG TPA: carbon storage regulator [Methylophaga aminisulfidivorans]|uniref:Carbon storage regulator n=1 Tax=Methylophaga aminisulfidivorans TaxID=230105 RepID=A0A7C2A6M3_9GAMM|nr:carbon storage regulator [Methylophaga aminisulfidivorans]
MAFCFVCFYSYIIVITVESTSKGEVKLNFEAPKIVDILRDELHGR